jgi:hypothetical protein
MGDEGRPFGVGFQEQASNPSKLLRSRAVGSERWSQSAEAYLGQVGIRKANNPEPLLTRRKPKICGQNQGRFYLLGRIHWLPGYWVDGHRRIGGASLIWAYVVELWEPVALMSREKRKWQKPRGERTDAEHWGGPTRRSEEGW